MNTMRPRKKTKINPLKKGLNLSQFTNKFILKADITDLNAKLSSAEVAYTKSMDAIGASVNKVTLAETKLAQSEKNLTNILSQKKQYSETAGIKKANELYKERIALARQQVAIDKRVFAATEKQNAALVKNSKNIKENATNIRGQISAREAELAAVIKSEQRKRTEMAKTAKVSYKGAISGTRALTSDNQKLASSFSAMSNETVRHIRRLESYLVALYAIKRGYDATLGRGHEFNKLIETETIGLKLLIAQNLQDVDSRGRQLTALDKFTLAQLEANKAIQIARDINLETPQNFSQTIQVYKALTGQVLNLGGNLETVGKLTKQLSILASASGIDQQSFLKTVDTVLTGEGKQSQLTLALARFGITNELIKEYAKSGQVLELFEEKLGGVDVAGLALAQTWDGVGNKFLNVWDEMFAEIQRPMFDAMKEDIVETALYLKENKDSIIENSHALGVMVKTYIFPLIEAYALVKLGLLAYNKYVAISSALTLGFSKRMKQAQINSFAFGTSSNRLAVAIRGLGASLKTLALANAPLIAIAGAFELLSYHTKLEEEALANVSKALDTTIAQYVRLNNVSRLDKVEALDDGISRVKETLAELAKGIDYINGKNVGLVGGSSLSDLVQSVGFWDAILDTNKEMSAEIREQVKTQSTQLNLLLKKKAAFSGVTVEQLKVGENYRKANITLLAQREILDTLLNKKAEELAKNQKVSESLLAQIKNQEGVVSKQEESVKSADELVTAFDAAATSIYKVGDGVKLTDAEIKKATTSAYGLETAFTKLLFKKGEISKLDVIERDNLSQKAKIAATLKGTEKEEALLKQSFEYSGKVLSLQQQTTSSILDARISHAKSLKDNKRALDLEIERVELSKKNPKVKELEIATLINNYNQKGTKSALKTERIHDRYAKSKLKLLDEELKREILIAKIARGGTNNITEAETLRLNETYLRKELSIRQGTLTETAKLAKTDQTRALLQEQITEYLEVQLELIENMDEQDTWENKFKSIFDISNNSITGQFIDEFGSGIEAGLENAFSSVMSGLRDGVGVNETFANMNLGLSAASNLQSSDNVVFKAIGYGMEALGALFSNSLSEAEIEYARGRSEFDSESLTTIQEYVTKYQTPMLTETRSIARGITTMNTKFGTIANAISSNTNGLDLDGSDFQATSSYGTLGFSSRIEEFLGAGISFGAQTVDEFLKGVDAAGYESIKVSSSSWWGLVKNETIKEIEKDLPDEIGEDISDAFNDGINATLSAVNILGLDTKSIEDKIQSYVIDLGKLDFSELSATEQSEALSNALSGELDSMFSDAIGSIASPQNVSALNTMSQAGESYTETLVRAAVQHEYASKQVALLGQSIEDFATSDALVQAAGGLESFTSAMASFTQNFFSEEEQLEMLKLQLEMALHAENVALPATKAQFRALVLETQQRIISVKASISSMKAEAIAKQAGSEVGIASAVAELVAKGRIAQSQGDVIQQQIFGNNALIESSHNAGQAAVGFGKDIHTAIGAMVTGAGEAIQEGAQQSADGIDVDWDSITSPAIAAAQSELSNLESLYGTLMGNMDTFADYYGGVETATASATEALNDLEKSLLSIAKLKSVWGGSDTESARIVLEATRRYTGLESLTYENFLSRYEELTANGLALDDETQSNWESMSSALRADNDARVAVINTEKTFYEDILTRMDSALTGSLSPFNSIEQSAYLATRADAYLSEGDTTNYLTTLASKLERDMAMSVNREEYESLHSQYIRDLSTAEPEKKIDDVVDSVNGVKEELGYIKDQIDDMVIQAGLR